MSGASHNMVTQGVVTCSGARQGCTMGRCVVSLEEDCVMCHIVGIIVEWWCYIEPGYVRYDTMRCAMYQSSGVIVETERRITTYCKELGLVVGLLGGHYALQLVMESGFRCSRCVV